MVTDSAADPDTASVTAPAETSVMAPAVEADWRSVEESSVIATVPLVLKVNVPRFTMPAAASVIAPPPLALNDALPETVNDSVAAVAILIPVAERVALPVIAITAVAVVLTIADETNTNDDALLAAWSVVVESS